MIIRYDFSAMVMADNIQGLTQNFNDLNCGPVEVMVEHNRDLFGDFQFVNRGDAAKMLEEALTYIRSHELPKVYILIDEYDNFTNQLLTASTTRYNFVEGLVFCRIEPAVLLFVCQLDQLVL